MKKAVIFNRASRDTSGRAKSVSDQNEDNHAVCRANDWEVSAVFTENNVGASKYSIKKRSEYRSMLSYLQAHEATYVLVCWEGSRNDRTLKGHVELSGLLQDTDTKLCIGGRLLDLNNDDDEFFAGLDALINVKEAARLRKRVLRGQKANALAGKPHSRLPFGYHSDTDASVVRSMFDWIYKGQSGTSLAKHLNKQGVLTTTGKTWAYTQVKQLLINPAYIGKRVYRGEIIGEASWPALIDEEIYYTCLTRLTDSSRKVAREGGVAHLCSGQVVVCSKCKGRLRKHTIRNIAYYVCADNHCTSIKYDTLNSEVTQHVLMKLEDPSHWSQVLAGAMNRDAEVQEARSELARLKSEMNDALALWKAKKLSVKAFAVMESDLQAQIAAAEKITQSGINPLLIEANSGPSVREIWERWSIEQRRDVIMTLYSIELHLKGSDKRVVFIPK